MANDKIELAEVVQQLRGELAKAMEAGEGEKLRFAVEEVQLEAEVAVTRSGEGKAGVKFWVIDAEAGGRQEVSRTQKVTLTLKPQTAEGGTVQLKRQR